MYSGRHLWKIASRALYYGVLVTVANGYGVLDLWRTPNCWAGQTVNVNPGDDLQTPVSEYPPSTTFSLAPGIHRPQSVRPQDYDAFVGQTGAILSGAGLLINFSQKGPYWVSHVQVWQAAAYPGECNSTHPACPLPEDLFFDNVPKKRMTTLSQVGPGSWYLDYSTGTVYMGDDPTGYTVELSLSTYAFTGGIFINMRARPWAWPWKEAALIIPFTQAETTPS